MKELYDVLVIGGGIVGSAVARELSRYRLRIGVLEKNLMSAMRPAGAIPAWFTAVLLMTEEV